MKTPEEYFNEQPFVPEQAEAGSSLEDSFLRKFFGRTKIAQEQRAAKEGPFDLGVDSSVPVKEVKEGQQAVQGEEREESPVIEKRDVPGQRSTSAISQEKFVGFEVGSQEFALSILDIKEVVKKCQITRLPNAPSFIAGVASLRGKITPVLHMSGLLELPPCAETNFVVVCRYKDLQLGLLVEKICSMYKVDARDIDREFDMQFGGGQFFSALLNVAGRLLPVVSVKQIVRSALQLE